jgi:hypothetical protein
MREPSFGARVSAALSCLLIQSVSDRSNISAIDCHTNKKGLLGIEFL